MVNCLSRSVHTGGVSMYISNLLNFKEIFNETYGDNWFLALEVRGCKISGIYAGIYHSPSSSDKHFLEFMEDVWLQHIQVHEQKRIIITGDFNIDWTDHRKSSELRAITQAAGLKQRINDHTRITRTSSTTIDLVFTNFDDGVIEIFYDSKISDHETISMVYNFSDVDFSEIQKEKSYKCWNNYSKRRLLSLLQNKITPVSERISLHVVAENLEEALCSSMNQIICGIHTGISVLRHIGNKVWYNSSLAYIKRRRDYYLIIAKRTKTIENWSTYRIWRNIYVRELKNSKNKFIQNEIHAIQHDPKKLWKKIKALCNPGGCKDIDIEFDGNKESDNITAEKLNQFFTSSVEEIHDGIAAPSNRLNFVFPSLSSQLRCFKTINMGTLRKVVMGLRNCAGVENINKTVLVDAFDLIKENLLYIVNESMLRGECPQSWKKSVVIPIPKNPKSSKPEERRPVNMLPLYEKVLEIVIKDQLLEHITKNGILVDEQSGFRKHHSCETALNLLLLKWKQAIEAKKIVLAVFIDLKRAFETIDRLKLLNLLYNCNVTGPALNWFESYLNGRTQITIYRDSKSSEGPVNLGVPQGSVLGPLLFLLYINDIKQVLNDSDVNLFADDTVIFVVAETLQDCYTKMNHELQNLDEWLKWKKLKLNINKTKYMVVSTRNFGSEGLSINIDGQTVERASSIKYLGVILDETLHFDEHINYTIKKAAQKYGVLCRINRFLTFESKITIYKALVAPHFDYCASVLFLANKRQMQRMQIVQNKAMRLILRCDRLTSRRFMLDCLQWMSVGQRIKYCTLTFIHKMTKGMTPNYLQNTITYGRDMHRYNTRQASDLRTMNFRMSCTQNSLFYKGYRLYNTLPNEAKTATSLRTFRSICKEFLKHDLDF